MSAEENKQALIRDAFINGLSSANIRQRLLENTTLTLDKAFTQACTLDQAQKNSNAYNSTPIPLNTSVVHPPSSSNNVPVADLNAITRQFNKNCYFCGGNRHDRRRCPTKDSICNKCGKEGHFAKVCQSAPKSSDNSTSASILTTNNSENQTLASSQAFQLYPTLASMTSAAAGNLQKAVVTIGINSFEMQSIATEALIDTGSSDSYLSKSLANKLNLKIRPKHTTVSMAESSVQVNSIGYAAVNITLKDFLYKDVKLTILDHLCCDVIIGQDILCQHENLVIAFGGSKPPMSICALSTLNVPPPALFGNLVKDCKPFATKSRRYTSPDRKFIEVEINRLLKEDIIEPSVSPWRAQVLVTSDDRHKKRMVIDYSQTINRYTQLDAYPPPRIDDQINEIAKNSVFSAIDLKDAYYQVPLSNEDKKYTSFEACGKLYQYKRMPFSVTNGMSCFQRAMDNFIAYNQLEGTFAYLDNITVSGRNQEQHDLNLYRFL